MLDAYFSSTLPGGRGDRNNTNAAAAAANVSGGGGRTTFAFAEILETARSSTLDDLGSLLETIAEARQQQQEQQEQAAKATTMTTETEAAEEEEEEEARRKQQQQRPSLPPPRPPGVRPRFVAVHPSCASHIKSSRGKTKKSKFSRLRLASLSLPQLQLLLQVGAAVGLSSCFVLVDALAFRQACSAVGFVLIVMLIGSSASTVGARLVSCASFVLPMLIGAVGGGAAASLAREVAGVVVVVPSSPSSSPFPPSYYVKAREPHFTVSLVGFNLFVLALASAWR